MSRYRVRFMNPTRSFIVRASRGTTEAFQLACAAEHLLERPPRDRERSEATTRYDLLPDEEPGEEVATTPRELLGKMYVMLDTCASCMDDVNRKRYKKRIDDLLAEASKALHLR